MFGKLFGKKGDEKKPEPQKPPAPQSSVTQSAPVKPASTPQPASVPSVSRGVPTGTGPLRIEIDRQQCTGMQECIKCAPGVFELDHENIATVVDPDAATREQIILAAEDCPTQSIKLFEHDGTKVYPIHLK